ncbi:hypothetical protein [Helicobacter sp. 23-1045]
MNQKIDCFVVFASLTLPRNDEVGARFCELEIFRFAQNDNEKYFANFRKIND